MLEMKLRDKVAGSLLGVQWERTDTSFLGQDGHVGCSMIAQKLEDFASGVPAKEIAAKERRKLREAPAGGKKR